MKDKWCFFLLHQNNHHQPQLALSSDLCIKDWRKTSMPFQSPGTNFCCQLPKLVPQHKNSSRKIKSIDGFGLCACQWHLRQEQTCELNFLSGIGMPFATGNCDSKKEQVFEQKHLLWDVSIMLFNICSVWNQISKWIKKDLWIAKQKFWAAKSFLLSCLIQSQTCYLHLQTMKELSNQVHQIIPVMIFVLSRWCFWDGEAHNLSRKHRS